MHSAHRHRRTMADPANVPDLAALTLVAAPARQNQIISIILASVREGDEIRQVPSVFTAAVVAALVVAIADEG